MVAKFKKNTKEGDKNTSMDKSKFYKESKSLSKIWYNRSDTSSPTSKDSSPKAKKNNPNVRSPQKPKTVVIDMKAQKNILGNLVTDHSKFLTEKISRIDTRVFETENSAVKIPKLEDITSPPNNDEVNTSPMHSKSPSRIKMESLARLLGAKKDTEEGWTSIKSQQNSMSESGLNLYDQMNGFLIKDTNNKK